MKRVILLLVPILAVVIGVVLVTQVRAHNDAGPTAEIGVHACIASEGQGFGQDYFIDPGFDCDSPADERIDWGTWEAFVSAVSGLTSIECLTSGRGLDSLPAGTFDAPELVILAETTRIEADAFIYVLLSSGGWNSAGADRQDILNNAGITELMIDDARDVLIADYVPVIGGEKSDSWAQAVLRALGEGLLCRLDEMQEQIDGTPQGDPGPKGDQGATGATGATGPAGADGQDGQDGAPATSVIGGATGSKKQDFLDNKRITYVTMFFSNASLQREAVEQPMPLAGTLSNLHITLDDSPGDGSSYTFTVLNNGTPTNVFCDIPGSATTCTCTDGDCLAGFAPGESLSIQSSPSGGPAKRQMRWTAMYGP